MTKLKDRIDELKKEVALKEKKYNDVMVERDREMRRFGVVGAMNTRLNELSLEIMSLNEDIEDLVRERYYEKDIEDGGDGLPYAKKKEFVALAGSEFDTGVLSDIDDLLEVGSEVPYNLDNDILTLFGTNRALYEKLMTEDRVSRLLKKNDYYIANGNELSIKLYFMNYYGTSSNKKYLSEYLAYNNKKVKRKDYVEGVRELISFDDGEQFTEKEAVDMFKELIKWW